MSSANAEPYGLADPHMLSKIDKLFACGVGELVNLPQIVVVGDQSSGKSSVLEGLIKMPLPRDSGLCTRFATHIVFRRAVEPRITVSIKPDRHAPAEHRNRVRAWGRAVADLDSDAFRTIMQEAHEIMGLSGARNEAQQKPTFSNDVLDLEISGPDQEHLSVIDVPGIFKSTTEGVTTKADIQLVRTMVEKCMKNPRSVMLAVIPANVDMATQEVLELAAEFDPDGDRTLGVLTKPDLVDAGAEMDVVDVVEGHTRSMKLGWHIIRSPGQKELRDSALDRDELEAAFFRSQAPWDDIGRDKVGIDTLRLRLKDVLSSLVKSEFPKVKTEIHTRLLGCRDKLRDLGPERQSPADQMAYLTRLATKFQRLVSLALNATHGAEDAFESNSALRIAPAIMSRMKTFSDEMLKYGQAYSFMPEDSSDASENAPKSEEENEGEATELSFEIRKEEDVDELLDILHPPKRLPYPRSGETKNWLDGVFKANRGFELGTFNASILATVMKQQSSKWNDISMGFVSDVIVMVHKFITSALASICQDRNVCNSLIDKLSDELLVRYQNAISSATFLLQVENSGIPLTMNHYFNDNLQKSRQGNASARIKEHAVPTNNGLMVPLGKVTQNTKMMSNEEHVVQDIHDILQSYYKVARKTFVDCVGKQSAMHYLLQCENSPLALFSPALVSGLSASELKDLAGEAPALQRTRAQLVKEAASLNEARKILSSA